MVVMKCLLDRKGWKPKMYFFKRGFWENVELKMARNRKVMKVKTRKGTEKGLQQQCGK